jgi:hypothetical protein
MKSKLLLFILLLNLSGLQTKAQGTAIDLGIQNIRQEQSMWCWAAAAQQVIFWKMRAAPNQCELVAVAKNANAQYCCMNPQQCNVPGDFQNVQSLIAAYIGKPSSLAPPANPNVIFNALQQGKAIILYLQTSPTIGHFIVLRGMAWVNTPLGPKAVFYVNDPMAIYTQPIAFDNLLQIWRAAIVVD